MPVVHCHCSCSAMSAFDVSLGSCLMIRRKGNTLLHSFFPFILGDLAWHDHINEDTSKLRLMAVRFRMSNDHKEEHAGQAD
jgi:hypothetical protein